MSVLTIDISDFINLKDKLKSISNELIKEVDGVLYVNARNIQKTAKTLAPKDMGFLASSISVNAFKYLEYTINVNANYAAYVEFGTGKYAAAYVATLPPTWQEYARRFKGKTGGNLDVFLQSMIEWVKRKGLQGLTKSGNRKTGKKADADAYNIAYVIVISILRNGIHPHPFLYPAYNQQRKQIITDLEAVIKKFTT